MEEQTHHQMEQPLLTNFTKDITNVQYMCISINVAMYVPLTIFTS